MKQILIDLVTPLVEFPDEVVVAEKVGGDMTILDLKVAKNDIGKVIGKNGKIARCIRSILRAAAARENKRVIVNISE